MMDSETFRIFLSISETFRILIPRQEFWTGYQRGLRRLYEGDSFGTQEEHELWLSLLHDENDVNLWKGVGYRAGFSGENPDDWIRSFVKNDQSLEIFRISY